MSLWRDVSKKKEFTKERICQQFARPPGRKEKKNQAEYKSQLGDCYSFKK